MKVIDLGARYKTAFGYVAANESTNLRKQQFSKDNGISAAGVYVADSSFEEMTLKKADNQSLVFGNMMTSNPALQIFAPPPMITFSKGKKLIITEIDGTDAEVVERYGDKAWDVKIQGILVDMVNHRYPKQHVISLREFFEYNAPLDVIGEMFDDLNIKSIYTVDIELGGVAGYTDTIQYSISARSIRPVEFFFVKKNN